MDDADLIAPIIQKSPSGWRPWAWIKTNLSGGTNVPFGKIPDAYLPAKEIWVDAETANCSVILPWTLANPFQDFMLFASTGTITGALAGVAAAGSSASQKTSMTWGIGTENTDTPRIGYCIGNVLKEEVYTHMSATKVDSVVSTLIADIYEDIIWRSNFKKMYLYQGEIKNVEQILNPTTKLPETLKYAIDVDLNKKYDSDFIFSVSSYPITITKTNGTPAIAAIPAIPASPGPPPVAEVPEVPAVAAVSATVITANVTGITKTGKLILTFATAPTISTTPSAGDFYKLTTAWCLEDPYLMDGFWLGSESEGHTGMASSGANFFATTSNKPYDEGVITGAYFPFTPPTPAATTPPTPPPVPAIVPNIPLILPVGAKMVDSINQKWYFYPTAVVNQSAYYPDNKRYEITESAGIDGGISRIVKEMAIATDANRISFMAQTGIKYLRLELSKGGDPTRTNFHYPALKGQYFKWNNSYFKILNQVNGNTIDVSYLSIDGSAYLNPFSDYTIPAVPPSTSTTTGPITKYSIVNHFAWTINEYHMGIERKRIFSGKVLTMLNTSGSSIVTALVGSLVLIGVKVSGENASTWADLPPKSYSAPTYLKPKSFFKRFTLTHTHLSTEPAKFYDKGKGWIIYINGVPHIIDKFVIVPPASQGESYSMVFSVILSSEITSSIIGNSTYVSFDYNFPKAGNFNGQLNISLAQGTPTKGQTDVRLCMSGYWISPQFTASIGSDDAYVGICDGRYFGIGDAVASSNSNASLFVTVPGGAQCTSSLYHGEKYDEWVVYTDFYTRKLTIRQGTIDYTENPRKIEISIGVPKYREPMSAAQNGSVFNLNKTYNRVKNIEFDPPALTNPISTTSPEKVLLFTLGGSTTEYYGFMVSGVGKVNLEGFNFTGTNPNANPPTVTSANYRLKNVASSPVYAYKKRQNNAMSRLSLHIGWNTNEGPIKIANGSISNAIAEYVSNNQTLENIGFFDVFYLEDGEPIIIYSQSMPEFSLANTDTVAGVSTTTTFKNNSLTATTPNKWKYSNNCIMMIGSISDGNTWGCPLMKEPFGLVNQYPLMVMNSVEYLTYIYNQAQKELLIICKCYTGSGQMYIGCMCMSLMSLTYNLTYSPTKPLVCTPTAATGSSIPLTVTDKFLWRPVAMKDATLADTDKTYLPPSDYISDGYSWIPSYGREDVFVRVMGTNIKNANINADITDFGIMSAYCLKDGLCVILFSSAQGLRSIFSQNSGRTWFLSAIILSRNAGSGIMIDGRLFYITQYGIESKITNETNLESFILTKVGATASEIELKQKEVDKIPSILIWGENIRSQKISGYKSAQGVLKLFFYNVSNLLACLQGYNEKWEIAPNF